MRLEGITYQGPALDDEAVLTLLPPELQTLLRQVNGFVLYGGALHVRGACEEPLWHSLAEAWVGENAFHLLYREVAEGEIPFAQNAIGDQYLLRDGEVFQLAAETGKVLPVAPSLTGFFDAVGRAPFELLFMEPLRRMLESGGRLEPGQLIHVHPPFCTREVEAGVSLRPVDAETVIAYHADFAKKIAGLAEGEKVSMKEYGAEPGGGRLSTAEGV